MTNLSNFFGLFSLQRRPGFNNKRRSVYDFFFEHKVALWENYNIIIALLQIFQPAYLDKKYRLL